MTHSKRLIILLIVLLIAGLGASAYFIITEKSYSVSDFTGKNQEEVKEWVKDNSIPDDMVIYVYDYSDTVAKGNVISQSVKGGTELGTHDHVTFRISNGKDPDRKVFMTDFKGKKLDQIKKWFHENGFTKVTYNTEEHDDMDEGTFISVTPGAGSSVGINDPVTVVTSVKSPAKPDTVTFPDFTGYSEAQIESWADENNIYIRTVSEYSNTVNSGYFISADVAAGTEIDSGSTVRVYIAS